MFSHLGSLRDSALIASKQEVLRASQALVGSIDEGSALELITSVYSPELITRLDDFIAHKEAASFVMTDAALQHSIMDLERAVV